MNRLVFAMSPGVCSQVQIVFVCVLSCVSWHGLSFPSALGTILTCSVFHGINLYYAPQEDAQHALENMNDSEFYGRVLKVSIARPSAMKNKAVWAEADKWYDQNLKEDSREVEREMQREADKVRRL